MAVGGAETFSHLFSLLYGDESNHERWKEEEEEEEEEEEDRDMFEILRWPFAQKTSMGKARPDVTRGGEGDGGGGEERREEASDTNFD